MLFVVNNQHLLLLKFNNTIFSAWPASCRFALSGADSLYNLVQS